MSSTTPLFTAQERDELLRMFALLEQIPAGPELAPGNDQSAAPTCPLAEASTEHKKKNT